MGAPGPSLLGTGDGNATGHSSFQLSNPAGEISRPPEGAPGPSLLGTGDGNTTGHSSFQLPNPAGEISRPPEGAPGPSLLGTGDGSTTGHSSFQLPNPAGGAGSVRSPDHLRVPPVPRFWGPGMETPPDIPHFSCRIRRVAPVPVRSPDHAEGAPGPSLLGTGDGSTTGHSSFQLSNPLLQELPLRFLLGQRQSLFIRNPGLGCPAQPAAHIRAG